MKIQYYHRVLCELKRARIKKKKKNVLLFRENIYLTYILKETDQLSVTLPVHTISCSIIERDPCLVRILLREFDVYKNSARTSKRERKWRRGIIN